ncbi:MAG TPA: 3-deoxy-7-phosphoheptulonate synthase [Elusimicrobia bacterium]|nr:MAG: 3-deoxy-7-phosphoheptulonate synthase [Elusimicrobia bacterium RIFOXYA12_FULL_49_49]OGS06892.1 MAG: 3-deoxy-7-phosphoheptulonate synthase [Elusimicrobia bacterium RIFOXYA1_FULL_47_7]OGS10176.1 MAG: 3-deoxy-7-phosphoheptulonate synthase [Elusimicrobia bacterium RIFOXYB1_FULL_48_9]OGS14985.1 MAG: 3-deoxy-7-phosphoheptulonate synthase [Elusimicrobia bacterium RIFOXYA2_FULL_47_53]OGS26080.1 MAG: 3-deoxy-7-phosphoheptulonate synthase [Elusimicrobia bacterium RIFOXYB12_FULL_50_12]OGS29329.1 
MIITLKDGVPKKEVDIIINKIKKLKYIPHVSRGVDKTIIGVIGERAERYREMFESMEAVDHISEIEKPYKLASREFKKENTVIDLKGVKIGGQEIVVMAGPCAVESKETTLEIASFIKKLGVRILRGGAFKPRSSPYAFQGLGEKGLKILADAKKRTGLLLISEAMTPLEVWQVAKYCDIVQIGARNVQNYDLLKEAGKNRKPVLLKRGMATTIKELLLSAEYIMSQGNYNVILCERGIRTFEDSTRFTLDLNAVPVLKKLTHLPVVVDPSHGIGIREHVGTMAKAAVACGADGLIIEVHPRPEEALSDGPQSLLPGQFEALMFELRRIARAVDRII